MNRRMKQLLNTAPSANVALDLVAEATTKTHPWTPAAAVRNLPAKYQQAAREYFGVEARAAATIQTEVAKPTTPKQPAKSRKVPIRELESVYTGSVRVQYIKFEHVQGEPSKQIELGNPMRAVFEIKREMVRVVGYGFYNGGVRLGRVSELAGQRMLAGSSVITMLKREGKEQWARLSLWTS